MLKLRAIVFVIAAAFLIGAATISHPAPTPAEIKGVVEKMRAEEAALEREKAYLDAQQSVAKSTQALLSPTWAQVWIAGIGSAGLLISLGFSAAALYSTRKAMELQRESAKTELRAYLGLVTPVLENFGPGLEPRVKIRMQNYGSTPAFDLHEEAMVSVQPVARVYDLTRRQVPSGVTVQPGGFTQTTLNLQRPLSQQEFDEVTATPPTKALVVCGLVTYQTMEENHFVEFAVRFHAAPDQHHMINGANRTT